MQTAADAVDRGFFEAETSVETVLARLSDTVEPRLRELMTALIKHLHAFIKDVELTQDEWVWAIDFLTRAGQMSVNGRQEFILLSDVLGVSMLVDALSNRSVTGVTESTVLGPFHVTDAPRRANGESICLDGKGEPLLVCGQVTDQRGVAVLGATVDVWQANNDGFYDVQQPGVQPDMNLRGVFETDADGRFVFRSVKPRFYPIPMDGPVGQLLKATGRHPFRPAHLHFIISATGFRPLTTHLFVPDSDYLDSDPVFGVKKSLIGSFLLVDDADLAREYHMAAATFWMLDCDFVLADAAS